METWAWWRRRALAIWAAWKGRMTAIVAFIFALFGLRPIVTGADLDLLFQISGKRLRYRYPRHAQYRLSLGSPSTFGAGTFDN